VGSTTPPGPYAVPWIVNCQQAHFSRSYTTYTVENKFTPSMKIHCGILKDDTLQIGREVAILNNVLHPSRQMNGTYSLHHIASYLTKNMISVFTAITISNPIFTVHNKVQAKTSPVVFSSGIPIYPTRCNVTQFIYIRKLHYMFRVLLPPTIRSAYNCIYSAWHLSHRYCYLSLSRRSWNSVFRERYI